MSNSDSSPEEVQVHWNKRIRMLGPEEYQQEVLSGYRRALKVMEDLLEWIDKAMRGVQGQILFELIEEDEGRLDGGGDNVAYHRKLQKQQVYLERSVVEMRVKIQEMSKTPQKAAENF